MKWPWAKKETRAVDPSWDALSGMNMPGAGVNHRLAETLATVFACTQAISSAVASLPAFVFRLEERGRTVDNRHPLSRLIRRGPNEWQTWPDFLEWIIASALLRGNALVEVISDNAGRVVELRPVPWDNVQVLMLRSGRLAYDVSDITSIYGSTGRSRRLLQGEVIHLKDRSDDGLMGKSRLQRAAATIEAGLSVQNFSNAMFANGANPSGVLMVDGKLSLEAMDRLRDQFRKAYTGASNAAKAMVLDQGVRWQGVSVSPEDAELLASRRFSTEEIARIFQVPPPLVGIWDHSSFTNSETAGKWFAQHTLTPWVRKIEAEFTRSVFSEAAKSTHELEIDLSGFLRGDHQARWAEDTASP